MLNVAVKNIIAVLCLVIMLPLTGTAAELSRTGQRTCFDQSGNSIDHTGSGQDGDLQNGKIWPEPRFIDNGDGTVTDHLTGLMWMADGLYLGKMSWQAAMKGGELLKSPRKPDNRTLDLKSEYSDWFLPDIRQLEALFNGEEPDLHNWLNSWGFKNIQSGSYWSTTVSPNPYTAWTFRFDSGVAEQAARVESAVVLLARYASSPDAGTKSTDNSAAQVNSRFIDNGDGTVTDTSTSLMWLQDAACIGTADWQSSFTKLKSYNSNQASYNCGAKHNPYSDWNIPNRHELRSLVDHNTDLPALPASHPFSNVQPSYWTSTTAVFKPSQAYKIFMGTGELQVSDKETLLYIWPVRPAEKQAPRELPIHPAEKQDPRELPVRPVEKQAPRERITDQTQEPVYKKIHSMFRSSGERITVSWPAVRFADRGDGTLIDNKSGLMWLKDAQCLGKRKWAETSQAIERLNKYPHRVGCKEYTKTYEDWRLPDLATLAELTDGAPGAPADWLNKQGATDVAARDYWSTTENLLNIYYAWALNLKQGTPRNYSKTFPLFVWPVRMADSVQMTENKGWVHPKPLLTVNNRKDSLKIIQGDSITLAAAISEIDSIMKADFKIWYEAPDNSKWWLSSNSTWESEEKVLYHGNLFPLAEYPVFSGRTTEMAPGSYTIHFDISVLLEKDDLLPLFPTTFSSTFSLSIGTGMIDQSKVLWHPEQHNFMEKPIGLFPQLPPERQRTNEQVKFRYTLPKLVMPSPK